MSPQNAPRYGQIADELRRRIAAGELSPGDRVPSTREITRQWGVAMATATKVLTELRHEGLVRAVPGVGTVVETAGRQGRPAQPLPPRPHTPPPTPRAQHPDQAFTLERIVAAAVRIADAEGLPAVSMRRVATELGGATMSLYRHVTDKDDLLIQMMDATFSQWQFPATPPEGWRERLSLAAHMLWDMFRRHPWLAPALSVTRPQPAAGPMPYTEWVLATLEGQGLDLSTAFTAHLALFNHIRGTAVHVEMEAEAEAVSGLNDEEWMDTQEPALQAILATGRFPTLDRLATAGYDLNLDALFEFGLQRYLDGIATLLSPPTPLRETT
ncbi:TetR/AcrR family transcriptional regulator C-terminal domain-containing protein [Streptomyces sp. NPDC050315]|uniref:TetR/AcrR family transcriptional regulator C-terminal domain-containing protein n=1 Tax=Streptomyces sp. NPDC050315 TaxID=3155039 RepID=UPI00341344A5